MPGKLSLYVWTLRYLSFGQMACRARRLVRRRLWMWTGWQKALLAGSPPRIGQSLFPGLDLVLEPGPWSDERAAAIERARRVAAKEFAFLQHAVRYEGEILWNDERQSQLWRYHLHYFDYCQDLLLWARTSGSARKDAYHSFRSIARAWMHAHPKIRGDGWHPYTLSLRVVNWLEAIAGFFHEMQQDADFHNQLAASLRAQAEVLLKDLEWDVRGNHLIENLRALVWIGLSYQDNKSQQRLESALMFLRSQLDEQILVDGGHFERNPGYHAVVLKALIQIHCKLRRHDREIPLWLSTAIRRMLDFLVTVLPTTGDLPLLKDTTRGTTPHAWDLLAAGALCLGDRKYKRATYFGLFPALLFGRAGWEQFQAWPIGNESIGSVSLSSSGFHILRNDTTADHAIFDTGQPCPDYLPAHAHADLFSYELTMGGQPVIVDSGVYEYARGSWRDFFRSTRAHNTLEIAGHNQSEVWNSFRVARRARPRNEKHFHEAHFSWIQAEHSGYERLSTPATHRRTLAWLKPDCWLVVDEIWCPTVLRAASYLHFHPRLSLEAASESCWRLYGPSSDLWLTAWGADSAEVVRGSPLPHPQGWYSETFGMIEPNTVVVLSRSGASFFSFGYALSRVQPGAMAGRYDEQSKVSAATVRCGEQSWVVSTDARKPVLCL